MEALKSLVISELGVSESVHQLAFAQTPDLKGCSLINESQCIKQFKERLRRSATSPSDMSGPAVMYLPLGGSAPPGCPSIAESSVTGISQMVFLWTIMSVFAAVSNVVANINNNQNNNNNNNNNINLNIVSTQNTQISSNVNNANTISIMLPPPIPVLAGRRSLEAEMRLKRFIEREERLRKKRSLSTSQQNEGYATKEQVSIMALDILRHFFEPHNLGLAQSQESRDCLGRRLCQMSQNNIRPPSTLIDSAMLKLTSFALLYAELSDHSQAFIDFMEAIDEASTQQIDCEDLFWKCSTDDSIFILDKNPLKV